MSCVIQPSGRVALPQCLHGTGCKMPPRPCAGRRLSTSSYVSRWRPGQCANHHCKPHLLERMTQSATGRTFASMQAMTRHVLDAFYSFAFAVCRDPGKKHLQVSLAAALLDTADVRSAGTQLCVLVYCCRGPALSILLLPSGRQGGCTVAGAPARTLPIAGPLLRICGVQSEAGCQ